MYDDYTPGEILKGDNQSELSSDGSDETRIEDPGVTPQNHQDDPGISQEVPAGHYQSTPLKEPAPTHQLVVLDEGVTSVSALIEDVLDNSQTDTNVEIVTVDRTQDGLEAITRILSESTHRYSAVHIIAHGANAQIQLGSTMLNAEALRDYQIDLAGWNSSLETDADILLYGCEVARDEHGEWFINQLAELTGADIAASDDLTGHSALGGDWEFEYVVGEVETDLAFSANIQHNWFSTLASVTVTTTNDVVDGNLTNISGLMANPGADGEISLREAIIASNNTFSVADTIYLPSGFYALEITGSNNATGDLDINSDLTIVGSLDGNTVIDGSALNDRVLHITNNHTVLHNLTIQGGNTTENIGGGGIHVSGGSAIAELHNVIVKDNTAKIGGGIRSSGELIVTNSTFNGNTSTDDGGAIALSSGSSQLTQVTISENTAADTGGGIYGSSGNHTLTNVTISGNTAVNGGGGIAFVSGTTTVNNSTITNNSADTAGGVLRNSGTVVVSDTIIAGNSATSNIDISGTIVSNGNNIIGNDAGDSVGGSGYHTTDLLDESGLALGPLMDNGGVAQTHELLSGSAGIDGAGTPGANESDGRGFIVSDSNRDIGAFERNATPNLNHALVAHFNFDEGSGTTAIDASPVGNHGSFNNVAVWTPDSVTGDYAADFSNDNAGDSTLLTVPDNAAYDFGVEDFSVAFWYRMPTPTETVHLVGNFNGSSGAGFRIAATAGGQIQLQRSDGVINDSATIDTPFDSEWHHLTVSVDNGEARLFIDGHEHFPTFGGGTARNVDTNSPLTIGAINSSDGDFEGQLDDIRIYARTLSLSEAVQLATVDSTRDDGSPDIGAFEVLLISTAASVSGSAAPGLSDWDDQDVIQIGNPNLTLEFGDGSAGSSDGTFSERIDFNQFTGTSNDTDAIHQISRDFTFFGVDLRPGDILFSNSVGFLYTSNNAVSLNPANIHLFRPDIAEDYSTGTFTPNIVTTTDLGSTLISGFSVVETDTTVAGLTLSAGDLLYVDHGDNVYWHNRNTATSSVLLDNNGLGIASTITGLELIEYPQTIGDVTFDAGTLLLTLNSVEAAIGTNSIAADNSDVIAVSLTSTGTGTTTGTASIVFDGSDVGLTTAERFDALSLTGTQPQASLSVVTPDPQSVGEDSTLSFDADTATEISVSDSLDTSDAFIQVTLSVNDGVLNLAQTDGVTITSGGDGTSSLVIEGYESSLNPALDGLLFTPDPEFSGDVTLAVDAAFTSGLHARYTFDDTTANNQASASAFNGTFEGGASTTADPSRGEVLSLNGSGQYVKIDSAFYQASHLTLAAWVKRDNPFSLDEIISIGDTATNATGIRATSASTVFYYENSTGTQFVVSPVVLGTDWHHIAATFDDTNNIATLYIDGALAATRPEAESLSYLADTDTLIGKNASVGSFDFGGLIDDARVYGRVLTAAEITDLANDALIESSGITQLNSEQVQITVAPVNDAPRFNNTAVAPFISEIHYDNTGTDTGEAIEIAGPAGFDLTGWSLVRYNGSTPTAATVYGADSLSGVIPDEGDGFGAIAFPYLPNEIQNGPADGIALVDENGAVTELLSWNGTFVAADGPAATMTSTDIGVVEDGNTPAGTSMQLTDGGWVAEVPHTYNAENTDQTFALLDGGYPPETIDEDTPLTYSTARGNAISVSDIDAAGSPLSMTLQVANGTLTLGTTAGISGLAGNNSAEVTFSGTIASINNALNGLTYQPDPNYFGSDQITFTLDDLGNTGSGGNQIETAEARIYVAPVNDPPAAGGLQETWLADVAPTSLTGKISYHANAGHQTAQINLDGIDYYHGVGIHPNGGLAVAEYDLAGATEFSAVVGLNETIVTGGEVIFRVYVDGVEVFNTGIVSRSSPAIPVTIDTTGSSILRLEVDTVGSANGDHAVWADARLTGGTLQSTGSLSESAENGTPIGTYQGYDADAGDTLTYTLPDSAGGRFEIDANTGVVSVANSSLLDFEGVASHSITVRVDDGTDFIDHEVVIELTDVNEPPVGENKSIAVVEDTPYTFQISDFGFADPDGDQLTIIQIASLPANGTLTLHDIPLSLNQSISASELSAFVYTPPVNATGGSYDSFDFRVQDNRKLSASTTNRITISLLPVNDAPYLANIETGTAAYTEDDVPVIITGSTTIADVDDLNIIRATVSISNGYEAGFDQLNFEDLWGITGDFNPTTGTLILSGNATLTEYKIALQSVAFEHSSDNPSNLTRTVSFQVFDGDENSNLVSRDIQFHAVNDAPALIQPVKESVIAYDFENGSASITAGGPPLVVDAPVVISSGDQFTQGKHHLLFPIGESLSSTNPVRITTLPGVADSNEFSFSSKVRFDAGDGNREWERIFDFGGGSLKDNVFLARKADSNDLDFGAFEGAARVGGLQIENALSGIEGEWHHYGMTINSSGISKLYIDGQLVGTAQLASTPDYSAWTNNYLGTSNWARDRHFQGAMDDIAIFDRAITGSEMAALAGILLAPDLSLPENAINGTSLNITQGGDIDSTGLIYSIESQEHTGAFAIDPDTGKVSVGNSTLLDFESDQVHEVTVRVSDGQLFDEETYQITLTDAPEAVQSEPANQTIDEDGELTFSTPNGNPIFVSDGLAAGDPLLRVQISVNNGVLELSGVSGVTIVDGADSSNSMTLIGIDADIRNALNGSKYIPDAHYNGNATLDITTSIATLDELSGRYTFAGAEATDHSVGSRQHGAFIGDAKTTIDPDRGEVLSLDGNGGHVSIAGLFGEPENATLSAWVNLSTVAGNAEVISLGNNLQLRIDATGTNGNGITLAYRNGDTWERTESNVFIAGTGWNHVAATYDNINNIQSVYLNGTVIATTTRTEAITYDIGANTIIGAHGDGSSDYNFNGQIDDVQIYSRALSEVEIAELASATGTSVATNLTEVSGSTEITVNPVNDDPVNIGSLPNDVTVTEDLLSVVDLSALNLADFDAGSSDVTVTLTAAAGGQIALSPSPDLTFSGTAVAPTITGTISDLNAYFDNLGNIQYRHGNDHVTGDNADSISVSIRDNGNSGVGGGSDIALGTVNVDITAVNDEQLLATNLVATIAEGSTGNVITPALLQTTDVDHAPEQLIYTVTAVPANGMLSLNGTAVAVSDTFTQADINAGVISYDHNGSQTSFDSFGFTVDDGEGTVSSGTFDITISNVNDAPVISVPGPLTVDEDMPLAISGISVADEDDNLSTVRLNVNSGTLNVTLSGTASVSNGSNGSSDLTLAGSLADINDTLASLSYQGNLHFNGADTLTILSTDSSLATTSDVVTIIINPVNDDPVNTGTLPSAVTVIEDVSSEVDLADVDFSDVDAGASNLTVSLSTVTGGELTLASDASLTFAGTPTERTITGQLSDLNAYFNNTGNIRYLHSTDHINGGNIDTVSAYINDNGNTGSGGGNDILLGTISVDISAVNDEQMLTANIGRNVTEGSTGNAITPALLQTSDVDHAPEQLIYTVTAVPANGMLLLNGTALAVGDAFTQASINSGVLTYDHDGSQTSADAFGFTVDDGSGTASSGTFNITINNVNDAPVISVPGPLTVDEDVSLAITGISVTDDDDILSNVRLMANSGKLNVTLSGTASVSAGSNGSSDLALAGSLADINTTLASLSYQGNLHFNGGDTLTVLSTDSSLATSSDVVNITVNPVNDDPVNSGTLPSAVSVIEDVLSDVDLSSVDFGDVDAGASNLTVSLSTVTGGELTLASDASLTFAGTPTAPSITGQLSDLNAYFHNPGNIQYLHSTTNINGNNVDTITVAINDNGNTGSGGGADLLLGTVNVDISAVNDEQVLVANIGIKVAEGSTGNTISPALLLTADIDHTPEQLNYTVTAVPAYGMLLLRGTALATSDTFTQADINAGVLTYDHDGTQTSADAFSFSVDDGAGTASTGTFDFTISNVNDAPVLSVPGPLSVDEDLPLAISGISVTDDDDNISTVRLTVFSGSLSVAPEGTAAVTAGTNGSGDLTLSGTLGDINTTLESLSYQGSEHFHGMDTLTVLTTDSSGAVATGVVNITVNSINDDPVNTGTVVSSVTVIEDVQTYVDLSSLEFTDVDADTNALTVSLSTQTAGELTLAADAELSFSGTATALTITGSLNDLNTYFNNTRSIQYLHGTVHQAGDNADQIRVVINDNGNSGTGTGLDSLLGTIRVDITPVNDPPSGKDLVVPVTEDVTYVFSRVDFGFTDPVDNDNFHAISVVTIPQSGHLDNNGMPVVPGTIIDVADIDAGHFQYTPAFNATDVANEEFTFRVHDSGGITNGGLSVSQSINRLTFDVLESNAPPQREITELTVDEGQSIILSTDDLIATDSDNFKPDDLTIVITSLPAHGVLTLDGNVVETGTSITHDSLQRGLLRYTHDGSETSSDQFDIQVSDGGEDETMPATATVRLLINEVIDPAPAIADESLTLTFGGSFDSAENDLLDSGTSTLASQLTSQDPDLIVSLESAPLHGTVSIDNQGAFVYVHDGSAALQDSFQYRVTNLDGVFSIATVNVSVEPPIESAFARPDEIFVVERAAPIDRVTTTEEPATGSPPVEEASSPEEFEEELPHLFGQGTTTARLAATEERDEATLIDHNEIPVPMAALPAYLNDEIGVKQHNKPDTISLHYQQVAISTANLDIQEEIQLGALSNITGNTLFANALQQLEDDLEQAQKDQSRRYQIANNTQLGVSISVTAGIFAWFLRGGALFASAIASTPLWSFIDPVRVFVAKPTDGTSKHQRDQDHDELEKYFDEK